MPTFLFDEIIFGPVQSRRLGVSLGINLLPLHSKLCNFDCIYCECGRTFKQNFGKNTFHSREEVRNSLKAKLLEMKQKGKLPDVITFAGNGEPTMHPDFAAIIDDTLAIRNEIAPQAGLAVLSNATLIGKKQIAETLRKVDRNILKLDSAFDQTVQLINNPAPGFTVAKLTENLKQFNGKLTIQTMFVHGTYKNQPVDNTTEKEIARWLQLLAEIRPEMVMVYTIDRDTPSPGLKKVPPEILLNIARRVEELGIETQVSG